MKRSAAYVSILEPATPESWCCTFGSFVFFSPTHDRRSVVLSLQRTTTVSAYLLFVKTTERSHYRVSATALLPGFPCPVYTLLTC